MTLFICQSRQIKEVCVCLCGSVANYSLTHVPLVNKVNGRETKNIRVLKCFPCVLCASSERSERARVNLFMSLNFISSQIPLRCDGPLSWTLEPWNPGILESLTPWPLDPLWLGTRLRDCVERSEQRTLEHLNPWILESLNPCVREPASGFPGSDNNL